MHEMILCKLGEVVLKGLNRRSFEDKLMANVNRRVAKCGNFRIYAKQSTIYVEPKDENCAGEDQSSRERYRSVCCRTVFLCRSCRS